MKYYKQVKKNQKMNKSIIKTKLFILSFLIVGVVFAQEKVTKVSQSIKVDKDVTIDLNTSYTNIIFDTWNKSTIEIEAYVEGEDMSKQALEKISKSWSVDVDASQQNVSITTKGSGTNKWAYYISDDEDHDVHVILDELKYVIADVPEMIYDINIDMPELPEMPEMPELPELPEGIHNIQFNYEAYKKDGEKYLEEYTKKFESTFGKDYSKKMH